LAYINRDGIVVARPPFPESNGGPAGMYSEGHVLQRAAIGTAVGAIIGAIAGGGLESGNKPYRPVGVDLEISSTPSGATVYVVPLNEWERLRDCESKERDANLLTNDDMGALSKYLVSDKPGVTPVTSTKTEKTYIVVFSLRGKKVARRTSPTATKKPNTVAASFN